MNEVSMKSGTRAEILEYLRGKIKKTVRSPISFGEAHSDWPPEDCEYEGDIYEFEWNKVEKQIDDLIRSGSPVVIVSLPRNIGKYFREQFLVTDYAEQRIQMEMEAIDNVELRNQKLDALRLLLKMEDNSAELYNKIVKAMEKFDGVTLRIFPEPKPQQKGFKVRIG